MHYFLLTHPLLQVHLFLCVSSVETDPIQGEESLVIGVISTRFLVQEIIKGRGSLRTDPRSLLDF